MLPLLPFAAGLLAGAVAVKLLRAPRTREELDKVQDKARHGLEKAQDKLRDAAISGLAAVENSSAAMKLRLSAARAETSEAAPQSTPVASTPPAAAAKAPRRKTTKKAPAVNETAADQ